VKIYFQIALYKSRFNSIIESEYFKIKTICKKYLRIGDRFMSSNYYIDFKTEIPTKTDEFSVYSQQMTEYREAYQCLWLLESGSFVKLNLDLPKQQGISLSFTLCCVLVFGKMDCPISIYINDTPLIENFDPQNCGFYTQRFYVPAHITRQGRNEIEVRQVGGTTSVFLQRVCGENYTIPTSNSSWMASLPDDLPLADINIPGTHDAAAINAWTHTLYACHYSTITEQLNEGIRLLDVRLKVKKDAQGYAFATCHGNIGSSTGINEYQTFLSLMDECKTFLLQNSKEALILSLKVDDWAGYENDRENVLNTLNEVISRYPMKITGFEKLGTLKEMRGKIFLLNRINDNPRFGAPISWPDASPGGYVPDSPFRDFRLYVQDQYKGLPTISPTVSKYQLVIDTFTKKKDGEVLLNYASATWFGVMGVYIMGNLLQYFGDKVSSDRLKRFGWLMLDYESTEYQTDTYGKLSIVDMAIASNFNYAGYEQKFTVCDDEL
jgi:hypothetical protein